MAVEFISSYIGSHQCSSYPIQRQHREDGKQCLLTSSGIYPHSCPYTWLDSLDTTHRPTQPASATSVYSKRRESAHAIKIETDCNSHVQVKSELCSCDVCRKLFVGACHALQYEENIRGDTAVAMEIECSQEKEALVPNITAPMSNEHLSKFTCKDCGDDLVEDNDIYHMAKTLSLSSYDMAKHESARICLTCLTNNVVASISEKCELLDDVIQGIEYECPICMDVFQSRTEIRKHMETHDRIQNHVCPFCTKQFSDGKQFYSHFLTHEKKQKFTCRLCQQVFTCENIYRIHVKSHRTADAFRQPHNDERSRGVDKRKNANNNIYATTSLKDSDVITNSDVGAGIPNVGDSGANISYNELPVEDPSKRGYGCNMASDVLPAVIYGCEASDAAPRDNSEHDIYLNSHRGLRNEEKCFKQDRLTASLGCVGGVVRLQDEHIEVSSVEKNGVKNDRIDTGREGQEVGKNGGIETGSEGQEVGKNCGIETGREGQEVGKNVGIETGRDGGIETGRDGQEVGKNGGIETGREGQEVGKNVGIETGREGQELGKNGGIETGREGQEVGKNVGIETGSEGQEVGKNGGIETGREGQEVGKNGGIETGREGQEVGKNGGIETGREGQEVGKNGGTETGRMGQEAGKNGGIDTGSEEQKGEGKERTNASSEEQERAEDALSETSKKEKEKDKDVQIKPNDDFLAVRQRCLDVSHPEQRPTTLHGTHAADDGQDVPIKDTCIVEVRSKVSNELRGMEKTSSKEVFNLSCKKYNIDKSKKLHIKKTLVLPKTPFVAMVKKQTDGNNNAMSRDGSHHKVTHKQALNAKQLSPDSNNNNFESKKSGGLFDSNPISRHSTQATNTPSLKIANCCSGTDSNGNMALVSNFLLAEQSLDYVPRNQKQSSRKRHLSKRTRSISEEQRSKTKRRIGSSVRRMKKRRNCGSSLTSHERMSGNRSRLDRPQKLLEEAGDSYDKDVISSYPRNQLLSPDGQCEWTSDGQEILSSDNVSSEETGQSPDCNVVRSEDLVKLSDDPDITLKPFKCKYCTKSFRRRDHHYLHESIHEGRGPYTCDICSKSCQSRGDLVKHLTVHTGDRPFPCDVCQKSFTQRSNLKRHMATHAISVKKPPSDVFPCDTFSCDVCDKRFAQKAHMLRHRRLHTGDKPYSCHICDEKFFENHHLKRHLVKHDNGKIMECTVCGEKFTRSLEFSRHLRTHKQFKDYRPYTCNICDRGYDTRYNLVEHMLIHTGENPFTCDICNKSFSRKNDLNSHNKGKKHKKRMLKVVRKEQLKHQAVGGKIV